MSSERSDIYASGRDVAGGTPVLTSRGGRVRPDGRGVKSGSDGTRTRDLRRDRPVRRSRRLTTMDAQSLYSCGFSGLSRRDSAWLGEADLRRLLPVCCPAGRWSARPDLICDEALNGG